MNLGTQEYYDACVYTSAAGREQLRIAGLTLAKAIVGYSQDPGRQKEAGDLQRALESKEGALDLCITVRAVWLLGIRIKNPFTDATVEEQRGIEPAMVHLEQVAKNIYQGPGSSFPWLAALFVLAAAGGGYYMYRRYYKRAGAKASIGGIADYRWFVVTPSWKIAAGNEYREDAKEVMREFPPGSGLKIVTLRTLKARGINPKDKSRWSKGLDLSA